MYKDTRSLSIPHSVSWISICTHGLGLTWQAGSGRKHLCCVVQKHSSYDRVGRTGSWLQMNRLSWRNGRLKFKVAGKLLIVLEEFIEYTPI